MPVIAIDGLAAAGKGTLSLMLARHFGFAYLNTGLLYRAVAAISLDRAIDPSDSEALTLIAKTLDPESLDNPRLTKEAIGQHASTFISLIPDVRSALIDYQRDFSRQYPGAILDGRDIGTVICPQADVKLFVTASAEARARRRLLQENQPLDPEKLQKLIAALEARDRTDRDRPLAPSKPAEDALLIDTTELTIEEAFRAALELIEGRF